MKKSISKLFSVSLLLLISSAFAFSQGTNSKGWVLDKSVGNVDFYHKVTNCNGKKIIMLKFNNKNGKDVTVSWKDLCVSTAANMEKAEKLSEQKQLVLSPGVTAIEDCENAQQNEFLPRPTQMSPVYRGDETVQFSFKEIKVMR